MKNLKEREKIASRLQEALPGHSHAEIAEAIGCSRAVISKYLKGDLPNSVLIFHALAAAYKIDLHWIITGQPAPAAAKALDDASHAAARRMGNLFQRRDQAVRLMNAIDTIAASGLSTEGIAGVREELQSVIFSLQAEIIHEAHGPNRNSSPS